MATLQSTYSNYPAPGYPGMVANGEYHGPISRTCEDSAGIAFGKAVFRGSGDHGCTATAGGQFLGITVVNETLGLVAGQTADQYQQYDDVAIATRGVIFVTAGEDVTDGAQAYVTSAGAIVDTSTSNTILTGWFFDQTVASGGIVKLAKR